MITTFKTATSGLTAQPSTETLIVRSSSADDDSQTLTASGTSAGVAATDPIALSGQVEVLGGVEFAASSPLIALTGVTLGAVCAGTVTVLGQGIAASGRVIVSTNPKDGDTVLLGLTGFTQTYAFRSKAQSTIVCKAVADLTQGDYFSLALSGVSQHFWYSLDGTDTDIPTGLTGTLTKIDLTGLTTDAQVATATEAILEDVTSIISSAATATITVDYGILGVMAFTDGAGDALGTITVVSAGTADAANQVFIGATTDATATNLRDAINDTVGTEGSTYGTGTTANPYISATVSGTILTVTDRIACDRQLVWSFTQGTAIGQTQTLSLGVPTGGVDGATLVTLPHDTLSRYAALSLDDETLALGLLPPLINWYSDWVRVAGKSCTIYLDSGAVANNSVTAAYETTTDTLKATTRSTALTNLSAATQIANPNLCEYIRLHLTSTCTAVVSVNAKVVLAG